MQPVLLLLFAAVSGRGGLEAVAISRDGKSLAVAGQNRTVYVLDAGTLEVKQRLRMGARIGGLAWTPDGKSLLVEEETDTVRRIDAGTGKEQGRLADASGLTLSPTGDLVAVRDGKRADLPGIRLLDSATLALKALLPLTERASAFVFSADGKRLAVLENGHRTTERKIPLSETPMALKGLARWDFQQRNDGRGAWFRVFETASGKEVRKHELWYTSDSEGTRLAWVGEQVAVLNRFDSCARIAVGGAATMFQTGQRSMQSLASEGKIVWIGGRAGGSSGPLDGKRTAFVLDVLPGQAEFVGGWTTLADGSAYGVTTAWRVFRLGKDGKAGKTAAVF